MFETVRLALSLSAKALCQQGGSCLTSIIPVPLQRFWFVYAAFKVFFNIHSSVCASCLDFFFYRTSIPPHPVSLSSQQIPDWLTDCSIQLDRLIAYPQSAWLALVLWPQGFWALSVHLKLPKKHQRCVNATEVEKPLNVLKWAWLFNCQVFGNYS